MTTNSPDKVRTGTPVKTNFLSTLGHGNPAKVLPRSPRLSFEQACQFA